MIDSVEDIEFEELFEGRPRFAAPQLDYRHTQRYFVGHLMLEGKMQDIYLTDAPYEPGRLVWETWMRYREEE